MHSEERKTVGMGVRASVIGILSAACCVAFLSTCMVPPASQNPARTRPVPPTATGQQAASPSVQEAGTFTAGLGRPNIMVVVKDVPSDDIIAVTDQMLQTGATEAMIMRAFDSHGFPVVDAATVMQSIQKDQLRRILEGDNQAAVEVGLGTEADVVVAGTVQESRERRAAANAAETTDFVKIRLSARAINTATGEILGSTLLELEGPFNEDMARQRAADSAGAELSARVVETWRGRTNITEIYADNADYQRVQLLKSTITQETHGVDSVVTRSFEGRSAVVEVFSEVSSDQLLTQINRCTTVIPFSVKTFSGNRIDIRFLDAPQKCEPNLK